MPSTEMSKELSAKVESAIADLIADTDKARQSETFKQWLRAMATFHNYSHCNQILIWCARKDATRVAGYQAWKKVGRCVNKGEKAIYILAPLMRKITDTVTGLESMRVTGFRAVPVFDISQTTGDELPTIDIMGTTGEGGYEFEKAMGAAVRAKGIELYYTAITGGAYGLSYGGKIEVEESLSVEDRARTLAHEFAHEVLTHAKRRAESTKQQRELEAEAVAYAVMSHYGFSMPAGVYLATYEVTADMLTASLPVITAATRTIIEAIDKQRGTPEAAPEVPADVQSFWAHA